MNKKTDSQVLHWILGAALFLIGLFVCIALVGQSSQADNLLSSAGIFNANPTVDSLYFDTVDTFQTDGDGINEADRTITLTSGGDTTLNVSGVISDENGDADINYLKLDFWSPEATNSSCTTDANNCYEVVSCSTQPNDADSLTYNCAIDLAFWANSTATGGKEANGAEAYWTATIFVQDNQGSIAVKSETIDIETLLSLDMGTVIDWGTLSQGVSTTGVNNVDQLITQKGNDRADIQAYGSDMVCSNTGTIPVGNIRWEMTDSGWGGADSLSGNIGSPDTVDMNLPYQLTPSAVTDTVSWNIQIPEYDVSGTCSGTITMTAIASPD